MLSKDHRTVSGLMSKTMINLSIHGLKEWEEDLIHFTLCTLAGVEFGVITLISSGRDSDRFGRRIQENLFSSTLILIQTN